MSNRNGQVYLVFELNSPYPTANKELRGIFKTREEAVDAIVDNNAISPRHLLQKEEIEELQGNDDRTIKLLNKLVKGLFDNGCNTTCLSGANYTIETWTINEFY